MTASTKAGLRVLVCGGRSYGELAADTPQRLRGEERVRVYQQIQALNAEMGRRGVALVITDGGPGAARHARRWAAGCGVEAIEIRPNWDTDGQAARAIWADRMLGADRPDEIIVYPGAKKLRSFIFRARASGITVNEGGGPDGC